MKKRFKKNKIFEKLPVIIEILQKIDFLIEDETVGISEIAELIEKDPALTTKLLKLANSPFYGFPKRITSVKTALNFLGVNVVKILLIVNNFLEVSSKEDFLLWEHFIGVGMVSQLLAKKFNFEDSTTLYTLGLIHDIGLVIEKLNFPEEFKKILEEVKKGKCLVEVENEILKFNHCELGAYLMENWNFPERIVEPILAHHNLKKTKNYLKEATIIYLGDLFVWSRGIGKDVLFKKKEISFEVFNVIPLDSQKIKEIFFEIDLKIPEIKKILSLALS